MEQYPDYRAETYNQEEIEATSKRHVCSKDCRIHGCETAKEMRAKGQFPAPFFAGPNSPSMGEEAYQNLRYFG